MKFIFIFISFCLADHLLGQQFTFRLPIVQYQATNIDEIKDGISNDYYNRFLPNMEISAKYKKFILGINTYYSITYNKGTLLENSAKYSIVYLEPRTYSIYAGREIYNNEKFTANVGVGYTRIYNWDAVNNSDIFKWVGYYYWGSGSGFFVEGNPNFLLIWNSLTYRVSKKFELSLNNRLNPMFNAFKNSPNSHVGHDRLHLFVSQLMVGYNF